MRECRLERDVISICVFREVEIKCGQHCHDSDPDRCVGSITALKGFVRERMVCDQDVVDYLDILAPRIQRQIH